MPDSRYYRSSPPRRRKLEHLTILTYHVFIVTAVALVAVGASNASDSHATASAHAQAMTLSKVGVVLLFLGWLILAAQAVLSTMQRHKQPSSSTQSSRSDGRDPRSQHDDGTCLLIAVLLAQPFLLVRVASSLAYFVSGNPTINPSTSPLGARIGLYFLMELLAVLILLAAGIVTRNVQRHVPEDEVEAPTGHDMNMRQAAR